jgi:hypothetical protein
MARDAVIVRFPGDPKVVAPRYAEGLRRFRTAHPDIQPETIFLGSSDVTPNTLVVVLLWPEGVDHNVLGQFLVQNLKDLGLERPSGVDHLAVSTTGLAAIESL